MLLMVLVAGWGLDAPAAASVRVASACFLVARCLNPLRRLGDTRSVGAQFGRPGLPRPDESGLTGCACHCGWTKPEGCVLCLRFAQVDLGQVLALSCQGDDATLENFFDKLDRLSTKTVSAPSGRRCPFTHVACRWLPQGFQSFAPCSEPQGTCRWIKCWHRPSKLSSQKPMAGTITTDA